MRYLIVTEFITVDGVMEDPGGAEKLDRGGWAFRFDRGEDSDKFQLDELMEMRRSSAGQSAVQGLRRRKVPLWKNSDRQASDEALLELTCE
jgi:hypothetical protein